MDDLTTTYEGSRSLILSALRILDVYVDPILSVVTLAMVILLWMDHRRPPR